MTSCLKLSRPQSLCRIGVTKVAEKCGKESASSFLFGARERPSERKDVSCRRPRSAAAVGAGRGRGLERRARECVSRSESLRVSMPRDV